MECARQTWKFKLLFPSLYQPCFLSLTFFFAVSPSRHLHQSCILKWWPACRIFLPKPFRETFFLIGNKILPSFSYLTRDEAKYPQLSSDLWGAVATWSWLDLFSSSPRYSWNGYILQRDLCFKLFYYVSLRSLHAPRISAREKSSNQNSSWQTYNLASWKKAEARMPLLLLPALSTVKKLFYPL